MTVSLNEFDRVKFLVTKLDDSAWLIYNNLNNAEKLNYNFIKTKIVISKGSSSRIVSQRNVLSGIKKHSGEFLFNLVVVSLIVLKISFIPFTPTEVVPSY